MRRLLDRFCRQACLIALLAAGVLVAGAGPAAAHVEATADGAQAGTGPVTVVFFAEAESTTAGITRVKTQLPEGIRPEWVSLVSGPTGWALAPTADGYEVQGPDIGPGVDLEMTLSIQQLPPDITEVPLKTLLYYTDGQEDAWIELPTESNPEPENPAPVFPVAPAPPGATTSPTTSPTSSAAPSSSATASSAPATDRSAEASSEDVSWGGIVLLVGAIIVAAVAAAALWFWRRRAGGR